MALGHNLDTDGVIVIQMAPTTGTFRQLGESLEQARQEILDGQQHPARDPGAKRDRYVRAISRASMCLDRRLDRAVLDQMLRPAVYFTVLTSATADQQVILPINDEYERLSARLESAREVANAQHDYWTEAGVLVLPDTSYWVDEWRAFDRDDDLDFEVVFQQYSERKLTLVVPMVIVDELDGVSHKRGTGGADQRAKKALRFIQTHAGGPASEPSTVKDYCSTAEVRLAVVDFPPDHVRAPINDDEIVGVARTLAAATGEKVNLFSRDSSGFELRARLAGQRVTRPTIPEDPGSS